MNKVTYTVDPLVVDLGIVDQKLSFTITGSEQFCSDAAKAIMATIAKLEQEYIDREEKTVAWKCDVCDRGPCIIRSNYPHPNRCIGNLGIHAIWRPLNTEQFKREIKAMEE